MRPNQITTPKNEGWLRWAQFALGYTILAVLFGAFVRASFSGDGCGVSWPLCNGGLVSSESPAKTLVEFTHRVTTAVLGLLIMGMWLGSIKTFPKGNPLRKSLGWTFFFVCISGAIGAMLVRGQWVTYDKSVQRMIFMPIHLLDTFGMLAALTMAIWFASGRKKPRFGNAASKWAILSMGISNVLISMTGAISAMGKTAFDKELAAANSFTDRLNLHLSSEASPVLKGGVAHPLLATSLFLLVLWMGGLVIQNHTNTEVKRWTKYTIYGWTTQMVLGVANLLMSAPQAMQIIHLALGLLVWLCFVQMCAHVMTSKTESVEEPIEELKAERPQATPRELIKAYVALTKPRVISLLLLTTLGAQVMAQGGWPNGWLVLAVMIGGYFMAGASNTINMVLERDLDVAMERTASRPTVTHIISNKAALIFAFTLMTTSFALLWSVANLLTAWCAFLGLLTYVFVYTLWLKRRTPQNIVIGGAAGAFPPLVGWASVAGEISFLAWILFALILLWTPVHFWALAILIKDDYAKAGVPMLPVVKGDTHTAVQIVIYAVLTAAVSLAPLLSSGGMQPVTFGVMVLLNLGLLAQSVMLLQTTSRPRAKALFKYSMLYLTIFFVTLAVDRSIVK